MCDIVVSVSAVGFAIITTTLSIIVLCVSTSCVFVVLLFFESSTGHLRSVVPIFPGGDFNAVSDRARDRRGGFVDPSGRDSSAELVNLFVSSDAVDLWRTLHPADRVFTWTRPDGQFASRIDLIGCPRAFVALASFCSVLRGLSVLRGHCSVRDPSPGVSGQVLLEVEHQCFI